MAANTERASRREFITAVVAIVVGGLVSLAGVVVGCQSSRDSQRTAREAQREAARAQRGQADLTELRSVIDRAAADLQSLAVAAATVVTAEETGHPNARQLRRRRSAYRTAYYSQVRLVLRIGQGANAAETFKRAVGAYDDAASRIANPDRYPRAGHAPQAAIRRLIAGDKAADRFIAEARKLVGSQLPE